LTPPKQLELLLDSQTVARTAFDALSEKQATELVILDLRPVSLMTDFFVIGTAGSERQIRAAVDAATDQLREDCGRKPIAVEGLPDSGWMLIDFGDVMVHVFDPERRAYYDLESMWSEAPMVARMA